MELTWIGRYRAVVAAMIRHANVAQRMLSVRQYYKNYDFSLSPQEWQVLEFLLEHPNNTECMAAIADKLGIVPSTFSKCTASLVRCGLADKFMTKGNRKNVVLRCTEKGRQFYEEHVASFVAPYSMAFLRDYHLLPTSSCKPSPSRSTT
jgi:DNA-binding MarR family transcriptional regulator